MENIPQSKKLLLIIGVLVLIVIAGLLLFTQKSPTYQASLRPTELLPFANHKEVRTNVCAALEGSLISEICNDEFNKIGKNNLEKIRKLYSLLEKVELDKDISDYDRSLLADAIFASLPTKDSPLAQNSRLEKILAKIKNVVEYTSIAQAAESETEENFTKMMQEDLQKVVSGIPKGDNAWAITVMVSKHEWVNGERQPIYSEQRGEIYDPYPGVFSEDKSGYEQNKLVHMHSRVGSYASSQNILSGEIQSANGEMIAYKVSIMSWESKPYGADSVLVLAEAGPGEMSIKSDYHFTEPNYKGTDLLAGLLSAVQLPAHVQAKIDEKKKDKSCGDFTPGDAIPQDKVKCISGTPECPWSIHDPYLGLFCFNTLEEMNDLIGDNASPDGYSLEINAILRATTPTYSFTDVLKRPGDEAVNEWYDCSQKYKVEEVVSKCGPPFGASADGQGTELKPADTSKYDNYMEWVKCVDENAGNPVDVCSRILGMPAVDNNAYYEPSGSIQTVPR